MESYVFVFDICSSTSMIEDLVANEQPDAFARLLSALDTFLRKKSVAYAFEMYKFLGDGYILLFEASARLDRILAFYIELAAYTASALDWFVRDYLSSPSLPRVGITAGLDRGYIHPLNSSGQIEYFGKAINLAARLQGSLSKPEAVNRLLFASKLYVKIDDKVLRLACTERTRTLKNINKGQPIRCYEFNPGLETERVQALGGDKSVQRYQSLFRNSKQPLSHFRTTYGK